MPSFEVNLYVLVRLQAYIFVSKYSLAKGKVILPISYFGPIGYYRLFNAFSVSIECYENFQKRSIRNRAQILSSNGVLTLSVPLQKGKTSLGIKDVLIAYNDDWQTQHLRAINAAYGNAPYYEHYIDAIVRLIQLRHQKLFDLNMSICDFLIEKNLIDTFTYTTEYIRSENVNDQDYRNIKMDWKSRTPLEYDQVFEYKFGFVDGLSILDLIFNVGPEARLYLYNK